MLLSESVLNLPMEPWMDLSHDDPVEKLSANLLDTYPIHITSAGGRIGCIVWGNSDTRWPNQVQVIATETGNMFIIQGSYWGGIYICGSAASGFLKLLNLIQQHWS